MLPWCFVRITLPCPGSRLQLVCHCAAMDVCLSSHECVPYRRTVFIDSGYVRARVDFFSVTPPVSCVQLAVYAGWRLCVEFLRLTEGCVLATSRLPALYLHD
eukprot:scpid39673/ scgid17965/ 